MFDLIRDSPFGQTVNFLSNGQYFAYPEQRPDYQIPSRYLGSTTEETKGAPSRSSSLTFDIEPQRRLEGIAPTSLEEGILALEEKPTLHVDETPTEIVDWDGPNDPQNPQNWSTGKKAIVLATILILTFSIYIGSAIYTSSIPGLVEEFGISDVVGTLGLSLFVWGYGIGPMFLSPLQELPSLGRNPVYWATLLVFVVLQVPTALATNVPGIMVLRFIAGFFASPALATGGASIADMFGPQTVPYVIGLWAMAATAAPVCGPIVGSFAAAANGWRWPIWELLWISSFALICVTFFLPETLGDTILLKRAQRLRKLTGNQNLRSASEIRQASMSAREVAVDSFIRPFQLMTEPAVLFVNIYIALVYAIFYLFFEAFPLVFVDIYHFSFGISGVAFCGIIVGAFIAYAIYSSYLYFYLMPKWSRQGSLVPEDRLVIALYMGIFIPIALFIFGWSARPSVHWIVPIIGSMLYLPGVFILFQAALTYLPLSYPRHAASILASNDFFRSSVAGGFPLFGRIFYTRLGLGGGSSLLAGLAILMLPFLWLLIRNGAKLRALSKYAEA